MDSIAIIIGVVALMLIWGNLSISIKIVKYLRNEGFDASLFNNGFYVKGKIFDYVPLYKKVTMKKTGKTGKWYSLFYTSFILILVFLLLGILVVTGWK